MQVDIKVYSTLESIFIFPSRVRTATPANGEDYPVELDNTAIKIKPRSGATLTSLQVHLHGGERIAVRLKPAKSPYDVVLIHRFRYPPQNPKPQSTESCIKQDDDTEDIPINEMSHKPARLVNNVNTTGLANPWQGFIAARVHRRMSSTSLVESESTVPSEERFGPRRGRLAFSLRLILGATHLNHGANNNLGIEQKAWATMRGIGGYASLGKSRHLNIGGGIDFYRTDHAAINDMRNGASVSAIGGRVHAGGFVHTGHTVTPYVQLGIGATFARHSFEMSTSAESEFRLAGLFLFGAGVSWWFKDRLAVGFSTLVSVPMGGLDTGLAFEAGVRAEYAFGSSD